MLKASTIPASEELITARMTLSKNSKISGGRLSFCYLASLQRFHFPFPIPPTDAAIPINGRFKVDGFPSDETDVTDGSSFDKNDGCSLNQTAC